MGVTRFGQRTYWHLLELGQVPSTYDVASSNLHYYPRLGFAVRTPIADWYRRHQSESPFQADDWERFRDPRATTYRSYVALQRDQEAYVEGVLRHAHRGSTDVEPEWLDGLSRTLAPLRYPCHGLMMAASYLGSMAPSGRITIAAAFQAGDEIRRVHRLALRMHTLRLRSPTFGARAREIWEDDPAWQPLRELIERLLVTYDWGECFAALNLAIKPALDELIVGAFADRAWSAGDTVLASLLRALGDDSRWHEAWSRALAATAIEQRADNRAVLAHWIDVWRPRADAAVAALAPLLSDGGAIASTIARRDAALAACGLEAAR